MPKIVDHDKRKKDIAEATWRVISEQGMEGATVRNIAKEAGLSLGALQHYFSSQAGLLSYAMNLVIERVTLRIHAITARNSPPKEMVVEILLQMIPTDQETMLEIQVWYEFVMYARNKPELCSVQDDGVLSGLMVLFEKLDENHLIKKDLDLEIEIEKLYAIVDGLALHAALEPGRLDKERILSILKNHIDYLFVDSE
ncbi:TetR/AcrR family transcriptional regulator [Bacillus sp. JJ722]|uniref:TetR/AcrR family transcriptional regulator n=1 Tax=Bacillus sp. JJ722 TaxID=3122973 RepID=UPI002FFE7966